MISHIADITLEYDKEKHTHLPYRSSPSLLPRSLARFPVKTQERNMPLKKNEREDLEREHEDSNNKHETLQLAQEGCVQDEPFSLDDISENMP